MQIDFNIPEQTVARCLLLTRELDHKLNVLVKTFKGESKSGLVRKILEAYFEENPIESVRGNKRRPVPSASER